MLRKNNFGLKLVINVFGSRFYSSDQDELSREKILRESIIKKYPGLNLPPVTLTYGNFSNTNSSNGMGLTSNEFGSQPKRSSRLLLICLAGLMLVWTSKSISNQLSKSNLNIPLWAASLEDQAKHTLFCVQYDEKTRNALVAEFTLLRKTNPFLEFYSWLSIKKPEFSCGRKYNSVYAISTVSNALQMESVTASRIVSRVLLMGGGDERKRVDDLIDALNQTIGISNLLTSFSAASQPQVAPLHIPTYPVYPENKQVLENKSIQINADAGHSSVPIFPEHKL